MSDPAKNLISVQPRWWAQAAEDAQKLAKNTARVAALLPTIKANELTPQAIDVIDGILETVSNRADALGSELEAVKDGSSIYVIQPGKGDPGAPPIDLLALANAYQFGHVYGGQVIEERVWEHGDGPDALPSAFESIAKKLRALPPEEHKAAQVFLLLDRDAGPKGTTPVRR